MVEIGGEGSSLTGFRVRGGGFSGVWATGAVTLRHNVIEDNEVGPSWGGGGIYFRTEDCDFGETTAVISDNIVRRNHALSRGGGIFAWVKVRRYQDCSGEGKVLLIIANNVISRNSAGNNGGGLYAETFVNPERSAEIVVNRNVITGNEARGEFYERTGGGGLRVVTAGGGEERIVVSENTVTNNSANRSGGGVAAEVHPKWSALPGPEVRHRVEVSRNTIRGNETRHSGGGLAVELVGNHLGGFEQLQLVASDNLIERNSSNPESFYDFIAPGGGGVSAFVRSDVSQRTALSMRIQNNAIRNNRTLSFGGGLHVEVDAKSDYDRFDGYVIEQGTASLDVVGNLIEGNAAEWEAGDARGGGVYARMTSGYFSEVDLNLSLNTIVGNIVDNEAEGGGIHVEGGWPFGPGRPYDGTGVARLNSNIVAGNKAVGIGGPEPYPPEPETRAPTRLTVEVAYSDVVNNSGGDYSSWLGDLTGIDGNISIDPGFVDPSAGDFHLTADSPVVDAGDPVPPRATPMTDADGDPRIVDGVGDGIATVDMGYDENVPAVLQIEIDIKPDDYPNSINPGSRGMTPVAVLGSAEFDVTWIDGRTLRFGPARAAPAHRPSGPNSFTGHLEDVNLDGHTDLVTHYRTSETGIECGQATASLTGATTEGEAFEGSDSVRTVGCAGLRKGR